ncbi:hypothetical protein AVEN_164643-1 [Araneus ventricosus]|uniref:Uncharacterized protein n=1 Tax=Araneus ventricosus TaxID=182803 RepID=A0A4Y2SYX1_ARAVE|nr:hypothetical protein AVEN_129390-1 [Araneus ventricosus]GBN92856.1 hypothetical protein AVEN_164643-1 [Araneus ventricosus]
MKSTCARGKNDVTGSRRSEPIILSDFLPQFYKGRVCKYASGHGRPLPLETGTIAGSGKAQANILSIREARPHLLIRWLLIHGRGAPQWDRYKRVSSGELVPR